MKRIVSLLAALLLAMQITPARADMFAPSHTCSKPYVPTSFSSNSELESFKLDVEQYKRCIEDFVNDQKDAIKKHKEAADDAIDEWNSFVNYELR